MPKDKVYSIVGRRDLAKVVAALNEAVADGSVSALGPADQPPLSPQEIAALKAGLEDARDGRTKSLDLIRRKLRRKGDRWPR